MQFVKKKWFYKKFTKKAKTIKLGLNNLYIFPNIYGLYWIITIIVLYILGTNLEVNFTIFLSYLMLSVFLISIFLTHFNLHGLELSTTDQTINFANSEINYTIIIKSEKYRSNVRLKFIDQFSNYKIFKNIEKRKKTNFPALGVGIGAAAVSPGRLSPQQTLSWKWGPCFWHCGCWSCTHFVLPFFVLQL